MLLDRLGVGRGNELVLGLAADGIAEAFLEEGTRGVSLAEPGECRLADERVEGLIDPLGDHVCGHLDPELLEAGPGIGDGAGADSLRG